MLRADLLVGVAASGPLCSRIPSPRVWGNSRGGVSLERLPGGGSAAPSAGRQAGQGRVRDGGADPGSPPRRSPAVHPAVPPPMGAPGCGLAGSGRSGPRLPRVHSPSVERAGPLGSGSGSDGPTPRARRLHLLGEPRGRPAGQGRPLASNRPPASRGAPPAPPPQPRPGVGGLAPRVPAHPVAPAGWTPAPALTPALTPALAADGRTRSDASARPGPRAPLRRPGRPWPPIPWARRLPWGPLPVLAAARAWAWARGPQPGFPPVTPGRPTAWWGPALPPCPPAAREGLRRWTPSS